MNSFSEPDFATAQDTFALLTGDHHKAHALFKKFGGITEEENGLFKKARKTEVDLVALDERLHVVKPDW